jgi:hypothetical protein
VISTFAVYSGATVASATYFGTSLSVMGSAACGESVSAAETATFKEKLVLSAGEVVYLGGSFSLRNFVRLGSSLFFLGSIDFGGSMTSHDEADFQSPVSVLSTLCVGGASIPDASYAGASLSVRGILGAAADAVDLGEFTVG